MQSENGKILPLEYFSVILKFCASEFLPLDQDARLSDNLPSLENWNFFGVSLKEFKAKWHLRTSKFETNRKLKAKS